LATPTTGVPFPNTNGNYPALASTIVTYFDGPLDRDRLDGSYAAFDWVRVYKVITWQPEVEVDNCIPAHKATGQTLDVWPVIKYNKAMDSTTVNKTTVMVSEMNGAMVPPYSIEQMTPLRFRIKFEQPLAKGKTYNVALKSTVKDIIGNSMMRDTLLTFSTIADADTVNSLSQNLFRNAHLFPNPSNGNFSIINDELNHLPELSITVADVSGKIVFHEIRKPILGQNRLEMHLNMLESGVYFLKTMYEQAHKTFKLIIRR
jgi:hypothetical protein